jgi:hypothetical protein
MSYDYVAIVNPAGWIVGDISLFDSIAWMSNFHWVDNDWVEFKLEGCSSSGVERYARQHKDRFDQNQKKLRALGYKCVRVRVSKRREKGG